MKKKIPTGAKREIRKLLMVVGAGLLAGALVVGAMVYRSYAPRRYVVKNVLLAPDILTGRASLRDIDPHTRLERSWVFTNVDFFRVDPKNGFVNRYSVAPQSYETFYRAIEKKRSIKERPELRAHFEGKRVSSLVLSLSPTGRYAASYHPQQFQQVEFSSDGQLIRIELQEAGTWAYFHAGGLGVEALDLFAKGAS